MTTKTKANANGINPIWYDVAGIAAILLSVLVFFGDAIFGGKNFLSGGDNVAFYSFIPYLDEAAKSGEFPLWTPYIFGGMPSLASFLAAGERTWDFLGRAIFSIPRFVSNIFDNDTARLAMWYVIYGAGVFTLMRNKKFDRGVALFTAIAAVFSTWVIVWTVIGHSTKPVSFATLPWILLALERNREKFSLQNIFLLILPLIVLVTATHPQMMFYMGCATVLYLLTELVSRAITKTEPLSILKAGGALAIAGVLALGTHADMFMATREYTPSSTRGSAPLVQSTNNKVDASGGNDYEYATNWSFSPEEVSTFFVPNYYGFGKMKVDSPLVNSEEPVSLYFGQMPFTDAANYMGIGVLFLAILGAMYNRRDPFVIFLVVLSFFALLLSFGKNFPILYDVFYNLVPAFNKFRAPSMVLCLLQFAVPVLAGYGIRSVVNGAKQARPVENTLTKIVAGTAVLFFVMGFIWPPLVESSYKKAVATHFVKVGQAQSLEQVSPELTELVFSEMKSDWLATGAIALFFAILIWLTFNGTIKPRVAVPLFILLVIVDLWRVDKRHYNPTEGQPEQNVFAKTDVVDFIKQDKNLFRVVDFSNNPANWWAYHFVESVHGYSSAKLRVYQDMLDIAGVGPGREPAPGNSSVANPFLWNLLNVQYIVSNRPLFGPEVPPDFRSTNGQMVYINRTSLPRAWFVDTVKTESNQRTILTALRDGTFNPRTTAFLEQSAPSGIQAADSTATVRVVGRGNQKLTLATENSVKSLLVVSEIFYKEWHCYIDGVETEILKTNFMLRGVTVPAGKHTVEFRFESPAFETGRTLSIVSNIIASLIGIAGLGMWWMGKKKEGATAA